MTERINAFRRTRAFHLRRAHSHPLRTCPSPICQNRVQRLRAGLRPWTIAAHEKG